MSKHSNPQWQVVADTDCEPTWSSYLFCGLLELQAAGELSLRYRPRLSLHPREGFATLLEVTETGTGQQRRLAFDWRDNADLLCLRKLAACDLYFKRNFIPAVTQPPCPPALRAKLRPLGLSFSVRGRRERPFWVGVLAGIWKQEQSMVPGSLRRAVRLWWSALGTPRHLARLRPLELFEQYSLAAARPAVFYLANAYDPSLRHQVADTHAVTAGRAAVIRTLRRELGDRFVGGFVKEPYAEAAYPDCVHSERLSPAQYCARLKSCRLTVYTRGLRHSPAYKLAEGLASGRCVLAEPLRTELPQPLQGGREVLFFHSLGELVAQCQSLLAEPARQDHLSRAARHYYDQQVRPAQAVRRWLRTAFGARPHPVQRPRAGQTVEARL